VPPHVVNVDSEACGLKLIVTNCCTNNLLRGTVMNKLAINDKVMSDISTV